VNDDAWLTKRRPDVADLHSAGDSFAAGTGQELPLTRFAQSSRKRTAIRCSVRTPLIS
jgi:hypothetical protein